MRYRRLPNGIASFCPSCSRCGRNTRLDESQHFTSRDHVPPHKLAQAAGWVIRGRSWVCPACAQKERTAAA